MQNAINPTNMQNETRKKCVHAGTALFGFVFVAWHLPDGLDRYPLKYSPITGNQITTETARIDHKEGSIQATEGVNTHRAVAIFSEQPNSDSSAIQPEAEGAQESLTPQQEQLAYQLGTKLISDLASQATTLPDILNSSELAELAPLVQVRVVGNILKKVNNKELDLETVWPE